jgi:hypothetical protein
MLRNRSNLTRLIAASLAACAIAPATALAVPATDGQGVAAGGGPGVTTQNLTAPDQVDRVAGATATPQSLSAPDQVDRVAAGSPSQTLSGMQPAASQSSDDGVDTGVLIAALVGAALVAVAGIGLGRRIRVRTARQHTPA